MSYAFHQHVHFVAIFLMAPLHHIMWDFFKGFHIFGRGVYSNVIMMVRMVCKHAPSSVPSNFDTCEHFYYNIASFTSNVIGSRTKSPRTKPPRTKSPGQNPPIISPPQTFPLLNTFCFIEMLFSKASFLPPLLDVIYSMVMKWRSEAERGR